MPTDPPPLSQLRHLMPSGRWLFASLTAAVVAAVAGVGLVSAAGWLITASGLAGIAGAGTALEIFAPGALIRLFALTRTVGRYLERLLVHDAVFRLIAGLRRQLFHAWSQLPFPVLARLRDGSLLTRFLGDVQRLEGIHAGLLLPAAATLATSGLFLAAVFWLAGPALALLTAAGLVLVLMLLGQWLVRGTPTEMRITLARNRFSARLSDMLAAHRELSFADAGDHLADHIRRTADRIDRLEERQAGRAAWRDELVQMVFAVLATAILGLAGFLGTGTIAPGLPWLAMTLLGVIAVAGLFPGLATALRRWGAVRIALRRLEPNPLSPGESSAVFDREPAPEWTLEAIRLRRGLTDSPVFDGMHLAVPAGAQITITGPSGSGKSRLATLLCGLASPDGGRVLLDGQPVNSWPETTRFATVALLGQRNTLIEGTLHDNLSMGRPDMPTAETREALAAVGLADGGLGPGDWIGEESRPLSGGETRRVNLLRAVLTDTPAIILDEPFRGLDLATRDRVVIWLREQLAGKTLILLDHKPCPGLADNALYRMEDGDIIPDRQQ